MLHQSSTLTKKIDQTLRPMLETEGYDLILIEHQPSAKILRFYIDRLDGEGEAGITLDDCTRVSHWVGDILDAEGLSDAISGAFHLEVSSPGMDRPLARPRDFGRFVGRQIKVVLGAGEHVDFPGRRRFKGLLVNAEDSAGGGIELEVDASVVTIEYSQIAQARLVPEF